MDIDSIEPPEPEAGHLSAACPRCGHRLDGIVSSWTDCCPLAGTCAECGHHIDFAHVLVPEKYEPAWSFEHASGTAAAVRAFPRTMLRTIRPRAFWSQLKMSDEVRPGRLAGFLAMLLLTVMTVLWSAHAVIGVLYWSQIQTGRIVLRGDLQAGGVSQTPAAGLFFQPIRGQAFVPPDHLRTPGRVVMNGFLHPFSVRTTWNADIVTADGDEEQWIVHADGALTRPVALSHNVSSPGGQALQAFAQAVMIGTGFALMAGTLLPLTFILMPWTRARCGVRWRHLVRIWIYALPVPLFWALLSPVAGFVLGIAVIGRIVGFTPVMVAGFVMMFGWMLLWWGTAMSRHLRIPRPWFVATLLWLLSVLLLPMLLAAATKVALLLSMFG